METTEIKRSLIAARLRIEDGDEGILATMMREDAEKLLGYKVREANSQNAGSSEYKPLRAALGELQIEVLNVHDVREYMLHKVYEVERKKLAHERDTGVAPRGLSSDPGACWAHDLYWAEQPLNKYDGNVPDYVLNKAVALKRACPEVEFVVVHLTETPDPFLLAYIPSKKWSWQRDEAFFIEVWDEVEF